MILDFTTLSDNKIRQYLRFLKEDIFEMGEIERYILSGKCIKIKITYYDTIIIEPERIIFQPEIGAPTTILTIDNLRSCINLYKGLTDS